MADIRVLGKSDFEITFGFDPRTKMYFIGIIKGDEPPIPLMQSKSYSQIVDRWDHLADFREKDLTTVGDKKDADDGKPASTAASKKVDKGSKG